MILGAALLALPFVATANDDTAAPPAADTGFQQPQIIVRPASAGKVEEYRIGGQLYMIKVTPDKGPGYYLVDSDGDGSLDTRKDGLVNHIAIPAWVIKRWR